MTDRFDDAVAPRGRLEQDFERFQASGDHAAIARVFDECAPKLLLVAEHLTQDAAAAEDLVQTVFLAAIEDARQWRPGQRVLPWLAGMLAHRAVDLRRREGVRRASELPEMQALAGGDPAELAASAELAERVAEAVDALPGNQRQVLVLRLVHGLAPTEIAHALGLAPSTVRMRLKRGLERLRGTVPQVALAGALLVESGRGLTQVREIVLGRATELAVAAVPTTTAASVLGGALTMKLTGLLVGAVALAVAIWKLVPERPTRVQPVTVVAVERDRSASSSDGGSVVDPITAGLDARTRPADATPVRGCGLSLLVRFSSGEPAADVGVYVRPEAQADTASLGIEERTGAEGALALSELSPGPWRVHLDRSDREPVRVRLAPGRTESLELFVPIGVHATGTVVDRTGEPVARASVLRVSAEHHDLMQLVAETDAEGRFELRDLAPDSLLVARASGYQPSGGRFEGLVQGEPGEAIDVTLVLGARGQQVRGQVVDEDGRAVARALVAICVHEDAREELDGMPLPGVVEEPGRAAKAPELEAVFVRADEAGRFETDEVPAGRARLIARAPARDRNRGAVAWSVVDVPPHGTVDVELALGGGARLQGTVTAEGGRPWSGLQVEAEWKGTAELGQTEDALGPWIADRSATIEANGTFELHGLLPGRYDLRVVVPTQERSALEVLARGAGLIEEEIELAPGEVARWDPELPRRSTIAVRLLDPAGAPLAGWGIAVHAQPGHLDLATLSDPLSDSEGRVVVRDLELSPYQVTVHAPALDAGTWPPVVRLPVAVRDGVLPGPDEIEIQLAPTEVPSARLRGRLVDFDGEPVPATLRFLLDGWEDTSRIRTGDAYPNDDGSFESPPVNAGTFALQATATGYAQPRVLGTWSLGTGESLDVGVLRLPQPARVTIEPVGADGRVVEESRVLLKDAIGSWNGGYLYLEQGPNGRFRSPLLWPGQYLVAAEGDEHARGFIDLPLQAGDDLEAQVACPVGREVAFVVRVAPDPTGSSTGRLRVRFDDRDGRTVVQRTISADYGSEDTLRFELLLAPGDYRGHVENHPRNVPFPGDSVDFEFSLTANQEWIPLGVELR